MVKPEPKPKRNFDLCVHVKPLSTVMLRESCLAQGLDIGDGSFGGVSLSAEAQPRRSESRYKTAVCVSGQLRGFPIAYLSWTASPIWHVLAADDLFFVTPNSSSLHVWQRFLDSVRPVDVYVYSAEVVYKGHGSGRPAVSKTTQGRMEFNLDAFPEYSDSKFGSSLMQQWQLAKCREQIMSHEERTGMQYTHVMRLRADLAIGSGMFAQLRPQPSTSNPSAGPASTTALLGQSREAKPPAASPVNHESAQGTSRGAAPSRQPLQPPVQHPKPPHMQQHPKPPPAQHPKLHGRRLHAPQKWGRWKTDGPALHSWPVAVAACEQELADVQASNSSWMIGSDLALLGSRQVMLEHFFRGLDALIEKRKRRPHEKTTVQQVWYLVEGSAKQQLNAGLELRGVPRCAYILHPSILRAVGQGVRRFHSWGGEPTLEALQVHNVTLATWIERRMLLNLSTVKRCLQMSYDLPCNEDTNLACSRWTFTKMTGAQAPGEHRLDHSRMFGTVHIGDGSAETRAWQYQGKADPDGF